MSRILLWRRKKARIRRISLANAASSAPMGPPAPGLMSTNTDCPSSPCSATASKRATMSEAPPGGKVTMMCTALVGQDCAVTLPAETSGSIVWCEGDLTDSLLALAEDGGSITALSLTGLRASGDVALAVDFDGERVYREALSPEYETHYPNGERCGGSCEVAEIDVSVPAP